MNARHLLLTALAHLAIAAVAQHRPDASVECSVDVRSENGAHTVTITTEADGRTTTRVLKGAEAATWMTQHATCTVDHAEGPGTRCLVVVTDDDGRTDVKGTTKASVLRYRYTNRPKVVAAQGSDVADEVAPKDLAAVEAPEAPDGIFTIHPNPTDGTCTLQYRLPEAGPAEIVILDPTGREVYKGSTSGQGPHTTTIDLTGKGPGQFIAKLVQGGVTLFKKLVIN